MKQKTILNIILFTILLLSIVSSTTLSWNIDPVTNSEPDSISDSQLSSNNQDQKAFRIVDRSPVKISHNPVSPDQTQTTPAITLGTLSTNSYNIIQPTQITTDSVDITSPGNTSIAEFETDYLLQWEVDDINPCILLCDSRTYDIEVDDQLEVDGESWTSEDTITFQVADLLKGIYKVELILNDNSGETTSDTLYLTVEDQTAPSAVSLPSNLQYAEGSTGNTLSWEFTDPYPDTYVLYRNSNPINSSAWSSGEPITKNIDGLSFGNYNFTIVVNDTSGNSFNDQVVVDVIDTQSPVFSEFPTNQTIEYETSGHAINWTITENYEDSYVLYRNMQVYQSGEYASGQQLSLSIDGLEVGLYNFTLYVNDTSGNSNTNTAFVEVIDTTAPTIGIIDDITIEDGTERPQIDWPITEPSPAYYVIYQNGTLLTNTSYSSDDTISQSLDNLDLGVYNFTILVVDQYDNFQTDTVIIVIEDTTAPLIDNLNDTLTFDESNSDNELVWNISDANSGNYDIYLDTMKQLSTSFTTTGTISIGISGLSPGTHNYTLVATDNSGNQNSSTIFIDVIDTTAPQITSGLTNVTYSEGTTNNFYNVTATDSFPQNYEFYLNNSQQSADFWDDGELLSFDIDGYPTGVYNITILFFDSSQNNISLTIYLNVADIPVFKMEPTQLFYNATTGQELEWILSETDPDYYKLYHNSSLIANGTWTNNQAITVNLELYSLAYHNFTLMINDTLGNTAISQRIIHITDIPDIIQFPEDIQITEADGAYFAEWQAFDDQPANYFLYQNGSTIDNGTWVDTISYSFSNLPKGNYSIQLIIFDIHGNQHNHQFVISVIDATLPTITGGDITSIEYGSNQIFWFLLEDAYPLNYSLYYDTTVQDAGMWSNGQNYTINLQLLQLGNHTVTIMVMDASYNLQALEYQFTVIDTTAPVADVEAPATVSYTEAAPIQIASSDYFPNYYQLSINNSLMVEANWTNIDNIDYILANQNPGIYHFTVTIFDNLSNSVELQFSITVVDQLLPIFTTQPANTTVDEGMTHELLWQSEDRYPGSFELLFNNSQLVQAGQWQNTTQIILDLSQYFKGFYQFWLYIYDDSGNSQLSVVEITIQDNSAPQLVDTIGNQTIPLVDGSVNLWWEMQDTHPSQYSILVNGSTTTMGDWTDRIDFEFSTNQPGIYNISIQVLDEDSNSYIHHLLLEFYIIHTSVPDMVLTDEVYEGDRETISGSWLATGSTIEQGMVQVTANTTNQTVVYQMSFTVTNGSYTMLLDYTGFDQGEYEVIIEFTSFGYINQSHSYSITVLPYDIDVDIDYNDEFIPNQEYTITVHLSYLRNTTGLSLLDFIPNSRSPSNLSVTLALDVEYVDGTFDTITDIQFTDASGTVIFTLRPSETRNIYDIRGIGVQVQASGSSTATSSTASPELLPVVTQNQDQSLARLTNLIANNLDTILQIGIPILALLSLVGYLLYRRRRQLIAQKRRYEAAYEEIRAYQNIRVIIVQDSNGVMYAKLNLITMSVDSSLIGGLSSAISSFLSEIETHEATGFEVVEREGISILSHRSSYSAIILISNNQLSESLRSKVEESHELLDNIYLDRFSSGSGVQIEEERLIEILTENDFNIGMVGKLLLATDVETRDLISDGFTSEEISVFDALQNIYSNNDKFSRGTDIETLLNSLRDDDISFQFGSYVIVKLFEHGYIFLVSETLEGNVTLDLLPGSQEDDFQDSNIEDLEEDDNDDFDIADASDFL